MTFGLKWFSKDSGKADAAAEKRLCDAISKKLCITASYNKGPMHLMEPYAVYRQSEGGELMLSAKMHGHMHHDNLETMEVAKLSMIELTSQSFDPDARLAAASAQGSVVCAV